VATKVPVWRRAPNRRKVKVSTILSLPTRRPREAERAMEVLAEIGLLHDDRDVIGAWVERQLADVHPVIRQEAEFWIDILRNGGPRPRPRVAGTVRQKVSAIAPFLLHVSTDHASLREVVAEEITAWLAGRRDNHRSAGAIRDLFKTLTESRIIFGNPARTLRSGAAPKSVPVPVPPRDLRAVGQAAAANPALKVFVALIGIHALYPKTVRHLQLDDIDLHRNRLLLRGSDRPLDPYTRSAIIDYLGLRRQRWPHTTNRYLLVNKRTAHTGKPVTSVWMHDQFAGLPATAARLREARLLEEAAHIRDPLHVAAVFNVDPLTSLRYVKALQDDGPSG
jgi:hypothetical protein